MSSIKQGLLLLNLGSPKKPQANEIRKFLRDFLLDQHVITLPAGFRYLLVYGLVLPFRPQRLIPQYQSIWLKEGSPLIVYTQRLAQALAQHLKPSSSTDGYHVEYAMRYGEPNIASALKRLHEASVQKIILLPLFPQYATSTTGSVLAEVLRQWRKLSGTPSFEYLGHFYQQPFFIQAQAKIYRPLLMQFQPDALLLSYHGLPVRQIACHYALSKEKCRNTPCPLIENGNAYCYRAQCYTSSRALAHALKIDSLTYHTAFQSRFGRTQWIQPSTFESLRTLQQKGIKRLAVGCPSFICDCLETLEEIGVRLKAQWQAIGGNDFLLLPSLNDHPIWVSHLAQHIANR